MDLLTFACKLYLYTKKKNLRSFVLNALFVLLVVVKYVGKNQAYPCITRNQMVTVILLSRMNVQIRSIKYCLSAYQITLDKTELECLVMSSVLNRAHYF